MALSVKTLCLISAIPGVTLEYKQYDQIITLLFKWVQKFPDRVEPILALLISTFPEHTNKSSSLLVAKVLDICNTMPNDIGPLVGYNIIIAALSALPSSANTSQYLAVVPTILETASVPVPIHRLMHSLNIHHPKWTRNSIFFRNQLLHIIHQELANPTVRTDRLLISMRALLELTDLSYTDAIEMNALVLNQIHSKDSDVREYVVPVVLHLFRNQPYTLPLQTITYMTQETLADPVRSVRLHALKAFSDDTEKYLAQRDVFEYFVKFCSDESPQVANEALSILAKGATSPAALRVMLISSLKQMYSNFNLIIAESLPVWITFPHILEAARPILHIYADAVYGHLLEIIKRRFQDNETKEHALGYMTCAILREVDGSLIKSLSRLHIYCPTVPIKPILDIFCDILCKSSVPPWTKIAILKALKDLAQNEAIVELAPNLVQALMRIIQSNNSTKEVIKALKVVGSIGFSQIIPVEKKTPLVYKSSLARDPTQSKRFYLTRLHKYLIHLFDTVNLDSTKESVTKVICLLFSLEPEVIPSYLDSFLASFLAFISNSQSEHLGIFFKHLTGLVETAGYLIIPHTLDIFNALESHWHNNFTREACYVFSALVKSTMGRCESILNPIISVSFLLVKSKKDADHCASEIFSLLRAIAKYCPMYISAIVAGVLEIISNPQNPPFLHAESFDTLECVITHCKFEEHHAAIVRCLNTVLTRSQMRWRERAQQLLIQLQKPHEPPSLTPVLLAIPPPPDPMPLEDFIHHLMPPNNRQGCTPKEYITWFDALNDFLVRCSPSRVIRVMTFLPHLPKFAFKFAFIRAWSTFDDAEHRALSNCLNTVFKIQKLPEIILMQFIALAESAVLSGLDLNLDYSVVVKKCTQSRHFAKSLFFLEAMTFEDETLDQEAIEGLIRMNHAVSRNNEALALANKYQEKIGYEVWMALGEWERAANLLAQIDIPEKHIPERIQCLAAMDNWEAIRSLEDKFGDQSLTAQVKLARYFWTAELYRGTKEQALAFMDNTNGYTVEDCIKKAIMMIRYDRLKDAVSAVHLGWRYLGASVSAVEKQNKTLISRHLFEAGQLHELQEVIDIKNGTQSINTGTWIKRLRFYHNDPQKQKELFKIRSLVPDAVNLEAFAFHIIHCTKRGQPKSSVERLIDILFPDSDSDQHKFTVLLTTPSDDRLDQLKELITDCTPNLKPRVSTFIGKETLRNANTVADIEEALKYLKGGRRANTKLVNCLEILAYRTGSVDYAKSTVEVIHKLIDRKTDILVYQLHALLVKFPTLSREVENLFDQIDPAVLVPTLQVILKMLNNPSVAPTATHLARILGSHFPQETAFAILVRDDVGKKDLLEYISRENPTTFSQVSVISQKLTKISHPLINRWIDALEHPETIPSLAETLNVVPTNRVDSEFLHTFGKSLKMVVDAPDDHELIDSVHFSLVKRRDSVRVMPLSSLDEQLESKSNWILNVFGTSTKLARFYSTVQSLENGILITVIGVDGFRSHFEARTKLQSSQLRSAGFITLLNSIISNPLRRSQCIQVSTSVILVEKLRSSHSMYDMVVMYNKSIWRDIESELDMEISFYNNSANRELLLNETTGHELDFRKALLVTSKNARAWIHRTSMFAQSLGTLSAFSYFMGQIDLSPHMIIVNRISGKVALTSAEAGPAQKVPFRLTKMVKKALGAYGVDGPFGSALTDSIRTIWKYDRSLAPIVQFALADSIDACRLPSCYTHSEPLDDTLSSEVDGIYTRIQRDDISAVHTLIESAESISKLVQMPTHWIPWW